MGERRSNRGRLLVALAVVCAGVLCVVAAACAGGPVASGSTVLVGGSSGAPVPLVDKSKGKFRKADGEQVLSKFRSYSAALGSGDTLAACRLMSSQQRPSNNVKDATVAVPRPGSLSGCAAWMANQATGFKALASGDVNRACQLIGWRGIPAEGGQPVADAQCRYFLRQEYERVSSQWSGSSLSSLTGEQAAFVFSGWYQWGLLSAVPKRVELYRWSSCKWTGGDGGPGFAVVPLSQDFPFRTPPAAITATWPVAFIYIKLRSGQWSFHRLLRSGRSASVWASLTGRLCQPIVAPLPCGQESGQSQQEYALDESARFPPITTHDGWEAVLI